MAEIVFWGAALAAAYVYVGYRPRRSARPPTSSQTTRKIEPPAAAAGSF